MRKRIDLTGMKFNMLTVISLVYVKKESYWLCKCDCGNEKIVNGNNLKNGQTKSCGCLRKTIAIKKWKRELRKKIECP